MIRNSNTRNPSDQNFYTKKKLSSPLHDDNMHHAAQ